MTALDPIVVDPDIRRAETLPSAVYTDPRWFTRMCELVFAPSWQACPDLAPHDPGSCVPWTLLPGMCDEPLVAICDTTRRLRVLSNVCTHRGNVLVDEPCKASSIRCGYHGRRFDLAGRMTHMPEFDGVENFPSERDHLPPVAHARWGPLLFASLAPASPFEALLDPVRARLEPLGDGIDALRYDPALRRTYPIHANWALYCDNYLEGFHIPFVHPGLHEALDFGAYETELIPGGVLQVGIARDDDAVFELPAGHPDEGRRVAAYYLWLFPNLMLNFYPWGLSLNVVSPRAVDLTHVEYAGYRWTGRSRTGAGGDLDTVEREDQAVVTRVQRGVRARAYDRGRYAPRREQGVHHFHRLLAQALRPGG